MQPRGGVRPRVVLVAEDDDDIREVAVTALELVSGFRTLTATNGAEALHAARQHRPDAILLDVRMPVLDGLDALEALKHHPVTAHIPVVLLTASDGGQGCLHDVAGVIEKPFDPMSLGGQVSRLLGWAS